MFRTILHDVVDSTSERAFEALARGTARHGDVHVARGQTAGRGRLGRRWESAPGEGLYASVVVALPPPALPSPSSIGGPGLTIATGLALWEAVRDLGLGEAALDWPNDLVVRGAKLGGILVESRGLSAERPCYVAGIGLNVLQTSFPPVLEAERAVTSLARLGLRTTREAALAALLARLERWLTVLAADPEDLAAPYLAAARLAGARVVARTAERTVEGRVTGLSLAAGLALATADGSELRLPLAHLAEVTARGS